MKNFKGILNVTKKVLLIILSVSVVLLLIKLSGKSEEEQQYFELSEELKAAFTNADDLVVAMHKGFGEHAKSFTISYHTIEEYSEETKNLVDELVNFSMYNTDSPTEGDYIRYQYGGYKLNCQTSDCENGYDYQLTITPVYYSTLKEENDVDEKVKEILEELNLENRSSEREKVQAVYDYICTNVKYDHSHENNLHYYKDSTAYAALVKNYASCQGYAVAVFRLLKEVGVECRIVTGTGINSQGEEEFHAWNEVLIDGEYYNADATWDAGKESYEYFLIKDEEFKNHIKDEKTD